MHHNISNNKNLYIDFSLFKDSPPRGHVRLNSTETSLAVVPEQLRIELLTNRTIKKFEKSVTIEYKIENTDIKMKRELNILDNYEQDIFGNIESFRETIKLANWNSETSCLVLKSLLSDDIRREHKDMNDV
ncbi:hypothetical protein DMUE_4390 [Dictyocoela muelleri]|nr:hypothetical protein DMUE_4390 [Dictyocoela muelleri]